MLGEERDLAVMQPRDGVQLRLKRIRGRRGKAERGRRNKHESGHCSDETFQGQAHSANSERWGTVCPTVWNTSKQALDRSVGNDGRGAELGVLCGQGILP